MRRFGLFWVNIFLSGLFVKSWEIRRKRMKKVFALFVLLLLSPFGYADFDEGIEYQALANPQPTVDKGKIEVLELFWYGCPHCYYLEPELDAWLKNKPDDVVFVRVPAILGPSWELYARAFYTAELLGVIDKIHKPLFERIHKEKKQIRNMAQLKEFFVAQGVSAQDFENTYKSFAVITKTNRAKQAAGLYGIKGVPALVVNGKYRTSAREAGSSKGMLEVVDFLVERERAAAGGKTQETAQ
ncbi:MAG: thiol:disulfide interchange protein DsbA [Gammaproteobacteria bacterium]|nr:MAG: thiol:disulfide interchange protein DsbA [Gammaproteobacteria bacterium]